MRPHNLRSRKFIHRYPLFDRDSDNPDYQPNWPDHPELIDDSGMKGIRWDHSVYYQWFQYLLRNNNFKQYCENYNSLSLDEARANPMFRTYKHWGSKFKKFHSYKDDFRGWWHQVGAFLFVEPDMRVGPIKEPFYFKPDPYRDLHIRIPLHLSQKRIREDVMKMVAEAKEKLNEKVKEGKISGDPNKSQALFPINGNPSGEQLGRDLKAWDMKKTEKFSNFEIYKACGYSIPKKEYELRPDKRKQYSDYITKLIPKVERQIENAAIGKFPCSD